MRAYHRSGALAVQIEIADVELAHGAIEFLARTGIDGAGQSELGVVGDFKGLIEVARLDHHQHRAENLFLLERRLRRNVGNHGRLNEIAFARLSVTRAACDQASIFFADLDVAQDVIHRTFVDDGSHVRVRNRIAYCNTLDAGFQFFEELVIDALIDDGARAGRALLALEAESGRGHAFDGEVDVGVGIDDDGIFAAHFEHRALDPELAGLLLRGALVDVQSNLARAGERDVTDLGMRHQRVSERYPAAGTEVHHAFGHAAFFEQFDKLRRNCRRIARRLQDDGVAADDGSQRHAGHDGTGKIPRRNHGADAERNVGQSVALARQLHGRFSFREAQSLARIELAEVDSLGDIGIGFEPVLGDFKHQPCHVFQLALAHYISHVKQERRALLDRGVAPVTKSLRSGLYRRLDVFLASPLVNSDDLRRLGGIDGTNLVGGLDAFAADNQVILAAELATHFFDRGAHLAHVLFFAEIDKRLILERTLMKAKLQTRWGFHSCHREILSGTFIGC